MIIGVAVKFGDHIEVRLPKPNRHHHCFQYFSEITGLKSPPDDLQTGGKNQGFYTHTGRYLDRKQALSYARRIKQPICAEAHRYLFSEDIW